MIWIRILFHLDRMDPLFSSLLFHLVQQLAESLQVMKYLDMVIVIGRNTNLQTKVFLCIQYI
ncbi:MAG: hypothetical protein HXK86_06590 [Lachnospiraceae bacterium]|nr:hypothetical protein [Lachnospiraceae bacterium]